VETATTPAVTPPTTRRRAPVTLDVAAFGAIVVVAALTVFLPYAGDQALFARGAREIGRGAVYYRDFWDIKQPGVFWWFAGAGAVAGYGAAAIHVVEAVYLLAFAVVLRVAVRGRLRHAVLEPVVPLVAIGFYFLTATAGDRTVPEILAAFPLFLALWLAVLAIEHRERSVPWLAGSGLAGGIALVFKLVYAPIVVAFWIVALVVLARSGPDRRRTAVAGSVATIGGALVPLVAAAVYFVVAHAGRITFDTTFVYPPQVSRTASMHTTALARTLLRLTVEDYGVLILLAGAGLVVRPLRRWDPFTVMLVAWVGVGALVIAPQRWSAYQREQVLVPLAVLAVLGVDALWTSWRTRATPLAHALGVGVVVLALVLLASSARVLARNARDLARNGFGRTGADRAAIRRASSEYREIDDDLRAVAPVPGRPHASVYVLGNPLVYELLDRDQAIALNGWGPEQWVGAQFDQLRAQLGCALPAALYVDNFSRTTIDERSPATWRFVTGRYKPLRTSRDTGGFGLTLYARRADAPPAPRGCSVRS
jgi:hypothetical protein